MRAIHLPQPMGPAIARNRGWRSARGALVVFTDDDVVARPGWLAAIAAAHQRDPAAVIQGRTEPDQAARAYLQVIAKEPETVLRALGTLSAA